MNPSSSTGATAGGGRMPNQQPRPSRASMEGVSPLMYSCQQNNVQQVRQLLQRKPGCVRDRDRTGKTALHYCAENDGPDCVQLLLRAEPDLINSPDEEGYTPLHLAVIAGNKTMVRYLLETGGADPDALDAERHSCVHWATVCGELEVLEVLLERRGATSASLPDIHGAYPLHYAAQMAGQQQKTGLKSGLTTIAASGQQGIRALKRLIQHGVPVDVTDRDGRQPLLWAASSGSADALLALCNAGASVTAADKDGLTALHCAASRGHSDCLETLVALCGADVDLTDASGCTALFYAVTLGHADCAQLLLDCGANPNHQDKKGRTPGYCGATKGQMETLRLLSQHGADLWIRNGKGDVALHEAVASGRKDLVLWLLRTSSGGGGVGGSSSVLNGAGAVSQLTVTTSSTPVLSAHVVNNDGRSPLHVAAVNNNVEMCKILIDHGAEVNGIMRVSGAAAGGNAGGQLMTPLDAALKKGNRGCAKFLQLHGGLAAAKLTDSRALQRALSLAYTESQHAQMMAASRSRRVSVTVHHGANHLQMMDPSSSFASELLNSMNSVQHSNNGVGTDYPASLTDGNLTSRSTLPGGGISQQLPHQFSDNSLSSSRAQQHPIDLAMMDGPIGNLNIKTDESFSESNHNQHRKLKEPERTSADPAETESGMARRRRIRRTRASVQQNQRRSLTNLSQQSDPSIGRTSAIALPPPAPTDQELRWKSRQIYSDDDDDDSSSLEEELMIQQETSVNGRIEKSGQISLQRTSSHRSVGRSHPPSLSASRQHHRYSTSVSDVDHHHYNHQLNNKIETEFRSSAVPNHSLVTDSLTTTVDDGLVETERAISILSNHGTEGSSTVTVHHQSNGQKTPASRNSHNNDSGFSDLAQGPNGAGGKMSDRSTVSGTEEKSKSRSRMSDRSVSTTEENKKSSSLRRSTLFSEPENITSKDERMRLLADADLEKSSNTLPGTRIQRSFQHHQLRRTKSERNPVHPSTTILPYVSGSSNNNNGPAETAPTRDRTKYKSEIPVSVTRATQMKTRKYNLERKIFQQLLDLKQMQIRSGQANEQVFAKRLIDNFRKDAATVGLRPYDGSYSFQQLELYLYSQLRLVQGGRTLYLPQLTNNGQQQEEGREDEEELRDLNRSALVPIKPLPVDKCTHTTQRCTHAMYAYTSLPPACYTGIPCAAYIPYHRHFKTDHHNLMTVADHSGVNGRTVLPKLTNIPNNNHS